MAVRRRVEPNVLWKCREVHERLAIQLVCWHSVRHRLYGLWRVLFYNLPHDFETLPRLTLKAMYVFVNSSASIHSSSPLLDHRAA